MSQRMDYHPPKQVTAEVMAYPGPERRTESGVDLLARKMNHVCTSAVDHLQVAAALEASGITDAACREQYGYENVFELAAELYRRVPRRFVKKKLNRRKLIGTMVRELSHGPLFLLASVLYPVAYKLISGQHLIGGMVLATGFGWIWSMGIVHLAYQRENEGDSSGAARLLAGLAQIGVGLIALLSVPFAISSPFVLGLTVGLMCFQMGSAVLTFFKKEEYLLATMSPAFIATVWYVAFSGRSIGEAKWVFMANLASLLVTFAVGLWVAKTNQKGSESVLRSKYRKHLADSGPIMLYAAFSSGLILIEYSSFFAKNVGLSLSITPMVLCTGVMEWQFRRFRERASSLMSSNSSIERFSKQIWGALGVSISYYFGILLIVTLVLGFSLGWFDGLSNQRLLLLASNFFLGGAFFVGQILIDHKRMQILLKVFLAAFLLFIACFFWASFVEVPWAHSMGFLVSCALLFTGLVGSLSSSLFQVRHYR